MPDGQDGNNRLSEADNIELLEEKAAVAKRDAQSKRKQIPPFVQKLSSFLDGAKNTDLIRWSDRGDSFVVLDEDEFAKTLIPELFKHNNYASFVRQLNMYGFHKRVGLSDNSMKASERKNKSPSEYYNPYFKRGHPNLLWLINKPKGGTSKGNKGNKKPKEELDVDSDDDGRDGVEEIYRDTMPGNSRAISQAPEAGPLQTRELAVVQHQLAEIQKQQGAITNALTRLRKDHTQLFQQSLNFQNLHDRHENSINAILTFLATVYNRSLDGNSPQNFAQMFANGIPHDQHNQGNVVELGEPARVPQTPANMSSQRRHQRLLMAPPSKGRVETPSLAATPQAQNYPTSRSGTVEELFDASPPDTSDVKTEQDQQQQQQPDMMLNIINSTNAQNGANASAMEFPEMLSHYENANGQSPLTSEQRNTVLNMIANSSSAPGTNNALVSPTPPEPPNMDDIEYASADIDRLLQAHSANGDRLNNVLQPPLDPPGNVPPIDYNSFLNGLDTNDAMNNNLDLDQYLNTGAFYNGNDQTTSDFNFDDFGDTTGVGDSHFDLGMDGTNDGGRPNDNGNSSNSGMLDNDMDDATGNPMRSPSKKRRRK
ncbi:putative heat shock factor protein [Amylocarpus encephaloides]|uniref:Heat shock factor protein n=1 Tax=Amylocarpus encephaloides TaxID=45428 RepID=A0A9P7YAK2_9HELO|nr:putative heat shock factor protein [Amylocarpus encephaloides]